MSDVKVIRSLLANNAPLIAVVDAAKIMAGEIRQGTPMPAILITHISGVWSKELSAQSNFCRARVQVTVMAAGYPQKEQIMRLVRSAIPRKPGTVDGIIVDSILREADGPDLSDDTAGISMRVQDFMVLYYE